MQKILFVCLGNICRSPMAEAIFQQMITEKELSNQFECDSCGTANYHIGDTPDYRTIKVLKENNITTLHLGRQFSVQDFNKFDHILVMDQANLRDVLAKTSDPELKAKVSLMRKYDPQPTGKDVLDPYYGTIKDFEQCYSMLKKCCEHFLNQLNYSV